jgi:uncharacterized membrane protein
MSTILKNNSETVAHTPGRASSIGVWILQVVLAAIIAGGGISKLAGGVGLLIPALAGLASLGLAALLTGAVITDQFVLEQSPWLPLALLVVAAVIARARWSRTEAVVGTLLRR